MTIQILVFVYTVLCHPLTHAQNMLILILQLKKHNKILRTIEFFPVFSTSSVRQHLCPTTIHICYPLPACTSLARFVLLCYWNTIKSLYVSHSFYQVEDNHLKLRDVINIVQSVLHRYQLPVCEFVTIFVSFRSLEPLPLGDHYWNIRDAIVQNELLLLRMCQFGVKFSHPHK